MVPRIFQPVVTILIIGVLVVLRLAVSLDPVARIIGGNITQDQPESSQDARLSQLQTENNRLRRELGFNENSNQLVRADVMGKTVASFREAIRLGAGQTQGLSVDQPVLHQGFLIGRIASVEHSLATAIVLGDPDVRIPVVIGQARGIVLPQAGGLVIDQVVGDVATGDPVMSSGVDGIYPPGLLVGTVGDELPRDIFQRFVLNAPLDIHTLDFVTIRIN